MRVHAIAFLGRRFWALIFKSGLGAVLASTILSCGLKTAPQGDFLDERPQLPFHPLGADSREKEKSDDED